MTARWLNLALLIIFILTVPTGLFCYLRSPGMGYSAANAVVVPIAIVVIGLALIPSVAKGRLK